MLKNIEKFLCFQFGVPNLESYFRSVKTELLSNSTIFHKFSFFCRFSFTPFFLNKATKGLISENKFQHFLGG